MIVSIPPVVVVVDGENGVRTDFTDDADDLREVEIPLKENRYVGRKSGEIVAAAVPSGAHSKRDANVVVDLCDRSIVHERDRDADVRAETGNVSVVAPVVPVPSVSAPGEIWTERAADFELEIVAVVLTRAFDEVLSARLARCGNEAGDDSSEHED